MQLFSFVELIQDKSACKIVFVLACAHMSGVATALVS